MCHITQQCGTPERCCHVKHGHMFKVSILPKQRPFAGENLHWALENSRMGLRLTLSLCHTIPGEYKFGPKDLASVQHLLRFCSSSFPASPLWPRHLLEMSQQLSDLSLKMQFADYCKHLKQARGWGGVMVRMGRKENNILLKMCLFLCHIQTATRFWPFTKEMTTYLNS